MKMAKRKAAIPRLTIESRLTRADPSLGRVIRAVQARIGSQRPARSRASPFEALVRAVAYQNVSGKAAAAVFARLTEVITKPLTPAKVTAMRPRTVAKAGLSNTKVRTIFGLARWFEANRKLAGQLTRLSDAELVETFTAIPGIGAWTVNVLLIFNLGRLDVLPATDLGIRRGLQLTDGLHAIATHKQVRARSQIWSPYRSIASIYLWQAVKLKLKPVDLKRRKSTKAG
jgi:DNA-3-methyladenine glycosylase II